MILALLACAVQAADVPAERPSPADPALLTALAPTLSRLDADHDGRVVAAEYDAHLWHGPAFADVDLDHDGMLGPIELATLFLAQDPSTFDPDERNPLAGLAAAPPPPPMEPALRQAAAGGPEVQGMLLAGVMQWMEAEVHAKDPSRPLPPDPALYAATRAGRLDDARAQAVFRQLRDAWTAEGLTFPEGFVLDSRR